MLRVGRPTRGHLCFSKETVCDERRYVVEKRIGLEERKYSTGRVVVKLETHEEKEIALSSRATVTRCSTAVP